MAVTSDQADEVIASIAAGASLRRSLEERGIAYATWYRAMEADATIAERYARAKEAQADALADEIVDIADGRDGDKDAASRRVRVDARKWVAAKLRPKVWGEKVQHEHEGGIDVTHKLDWSGISDEHVRLLASIPIKEQ